MKKNTILGAIRASLGVSKDKRLQEKHDDAVEHLHRLEAESVFLNKMRMFHTARSASIDHNHDWWAFATSKQKQQDYEIEVTAVEDKIAIQRACVEARLAALNAHHDMC